MAVSEAIVICIDDSRWMRKDSREFQAQCDAIKHYCKAKFQAHEDTVVGLYTLATTRPRHLLYPPTGSLEKILDCLSKLYPGHGDLDLVTGLSFARIPLVPWIRVPDKKKRLLVFVGGLTNLNSHYAELLGKACRGTGVAVDVVNFYLGKTPKNREESEYQYGRSELDEFVHICNCNDDSHIVDVERGSDICEVLSNSILKNTPCHSEKENDNVKGELGLSGKNEAAADD